MAPGATSLRTHANEQCSCGGQFVFCRDCLQGYHIGDCLSDAASVTNTAQSSYSVDPQKATDARWDNASNVTIKIISKPCPQCRTPTERDGKCAAAQLAGNGSEMVQLLRFHSIRWVHAHGLHQSWLCLRMVLGVPDGVDSRLHGSPLVRMRIRAVVDSGAWNAQPCSAKQKV